MKHITISFRPEDTDLYQWFLSLTKRWSDKSYLGREALECYRLFNGSLAQAQDAARALAEIRRMFGDDWKEAVE